MNKNFFVSSCQQLADAVAFKTLELLGRTLLALYYSEEALTAKSGSGLHLFYHLGICWHSAHSDVLLTTSFFAPSGCEGDPEKLQLCPEVQFALLLCVCCRWHQCSEGKT